MQQKDVIRAFVIENFLYGQDDHTLTDEVSFLEKGIIDSTGVLELVSFVEEKFGFAVTDDEIIPDNFDSIGKLADFVAKKASTGPVAVQNA